MTEIKVYAPVVIPTLNRIEHFSRCLDSLEGCTGADKTDVFIGLDYPPTDEYVEGWKKICEYLKNKEKNNGFKSLTVVRRSYNYGITGAGSNGRQLLNKVLSDYDRFIYSEDDNVFSPNFLEYINKGLEIYKNDRRVIAICGYKNDFECKSRDNNHFAQHSLFQAWGFGMWSGKHHNAMENLTPSYFRRILYTPQKWYKCFYYWPHWFSCIISNAMSTKKNLPAHDINLGFYIINENKCVICPTISKVRNTGWDASATTTTLDKGNLRERAKHELNLVLDKDATFDFKGNPFIYEDENSFEIAKWDGQWETDLHKSLLYMYAHVIKFRLLALFGVI